MRIIYQILIQGFQLSWMLKLPASLESDKNMISNYNFLKPIDEIKFVICNLDDFNWARDYI